MCALMWSTNVYPRQEMASEVNPELPNAVRNPTFWARAWEGPMMLVFDLPCLAMISMGLLLVQPVGVARDWEFGVLVEEDNALGTDRTQLGSQSRWANAQSRPPVHRFEGEVRREPT